MKRALVALLLVLLPLALAAQEADSSEPADTASAPRGFINNIFFTGQFGGGPMVSAGAGIAFLDNIVRPEVLLGYTSGDGFSGFNVSAKLNARILALPINDWFGMYGTIGTAFVFFSSDSQIVSAAFVAEEFDLVDIVGIPSLSLYFEQDFFFLPTTEGNMLFQLGIGVRASVF